MDMNIISVLKMVGNQQNVHGDWTGMNREQLLEFTSFSLGNFWKPADKIIFKTGIQLVLYTLILLMKKEQLLQNGFHLT